MFVFKKMLFKFFYIFQIQYVRDKTTPSQVQELFSPFSSIAVWAAVRFVFQKRNSFMVNNNSQPNLNQFQKTSNELVYAFLPLISDPGKLTHSLNNYSFHSCLT